MTKLVDVVAVACLKGGVSKSTTALNLAHHLATDHSLDTLVIDGDRQGNLTEWLGFHDSYVGESDSLYDILSTISRLDELDSLVQTLNGRLFDIIPAHDDMNRLNDELDAGRRTEERLRLAIERSGLQAQYDVIVADTAAAEDAVLDNVLLAADQWVLPVQARESSVPGYYKLQKMRDGLDAAYGTSPNLTAAVVSEVRHDNESEEMLAFWETELDVPVVPIHERVDIQRACNAGVALAGYNPEDHSPNHDMVERFEQLANAVAPSLEVVANG